ncbi:MAG: hypothetical protein JWP41_1980 [Ramlibacter sp.]|nr:hypothetical protein [Ramlibacter sp.]
MRRRACLGACFAVLVALGGCAIAPLGAPVPSTDNIVKARAARTPPLALGDFKLAPGKPAGMDQKISIRSNTLHSPYGNSFAAYLKEALGGDLRAAGLLDPESPLVLSGQLTDSQIEVPTGTSHATVAARFVLTRSGAAVYDKELRARSEWQSGFVGIEAVPMAVNRYQLLYRELVGMLLADAQFQAAARR